MSKTSLCSCCANLASYVHVADAIVVREDGKRHRLTMMRRVWSHVDVPGFEESLYLTRFSLSDETWWLVDDLLDVVYAGTFEEVRKEDDRRHHMERLS